ncbi:ABC transporter permease [Rhizobium leguminosarum]|uniref:ABC transporter permease n=1 Tax=Rhizobium leguminosarum TaxID=384 RepID=UPI001FDFC8EB|nr:ABC transporter permease [Rhizobium leguminosarum]
MFAFTAIVWYTLTFTIVGRRLYAVGGNAEAARLSGINVLRYKILAFVLCSASAGFSGILFASRLRSISPGGLSAAELTVIAAAIPGGTSLFGGAGSVIKTLAGALLLFSLSNGFNILNLGANYQGLIEGIVVVVAAAIYTVGGKNAPRRSVQRHNNLAHPYASISHFVFAHAHLASARFPKKWSQVDLREPPNVTMATCRKGVMREGDEVRGHVSERWPPRIQKHTMRDGASQRRI